VFWGSNGVRQLSTLTDQWCGSVNGQEECEAKCEVCTGMSVLISAVGSFVFSLTSGCQAREDG
jgi:hypothetical protein